jgi:hypothetical protein
MPNPRVADEIKQRRGTYRADRADRSNAPANNGLCDGAYRRLRIARTLLDPESYAIYEEAIHRVEFDTPHIDGKHAIPSIDCLEDIELVEGGIDELLRSIGADEETTSILRLRSSDIYRLILDQQERSA